MILTFKPNVLESLKIERTVIELNKLEGVKASSEFITTIPRHYIVTIDADTSDVNDVFELGILVGVLNSL